MSPEQWRDASRVDHRSDLWSLAGTLYWILTGNVPRVIHPNRIPELIRPVLLKALESGPDQRYQSAGEFGQALQSVLTAMKRGERPEELLPGKCPVCSYLNDTAKKFCESCGAALREPCLDCHQPVEVWARFCGDCGVNVGAALERRLEQLEAEKHQIESFERSYRHADAILRAEQLAKIDHPRLTGYAEWAAEALKKLRSELKSLESDRDRLLSEAGQHFANYQYGDAEHFLEQIPEPLRIGRSNDLLQVSRRRHAECWKLSSKIRGALSTRSYEGLLPKLMKFSELRPNDEVARELRTKLETKELTDIINSAVAAKKFDGLLPKVERYLQLRPADEGAQILSLRLGRIENRSLTNGIGLKLVRIPLGEFLMGADDSDSSADVNEKPQHPIEITKPFYMSVYEVTQGQFEMVMECNPSEFSGRPGEDAVRLPVENVTWDEAVEFCRRLSERPEEKSAGRLYRLPTESEWEYACRAGTTTLFHVGDALSSTQANFDGTYPHGEAAIGPYLDATSVVGSYEPNGFGLYDVHGNVYEWCADWFDEEFYRQSPSSDPDGPFLGAKRVARGGSLCGTATNCRSSDRNSYEPENRSPYCGFRIVCVLDESPPALDESAS
jgi:formylglycine-generating enzyme required for sulfatase activity